MRIFVLVFLVSMFGICSAQTAPDGKTFSIKLKVSGPERPGIKWTKDELAFMNGSFTSKFMGEAEKFPPFQYIFVKDTSSAASVKFTATGENPGGSTIVWEGKITGDNIEGVATWTNMNGPQKQVFNGSLKAIK